MAPRLALLLAALGLVLAAAATAGDETIDGSERPAVPGARAAGVEPTLPPRSVEPRGPTRPLTRPPGAQQGPTRPGLYGQSPAGRRSAVGRPGAPARGR